MATYYNPQIVTNGLVLCLDAANTKSYPGSGTTWTDLSGQGNTGTLTNGPTFDSGNNGSIVFDGSNDFINISNSSSLQLTNQLTIIFWFMPNNFSSGRQGILGKNGLNEYTITLETNGSVSFYFSSANQPASYYNGASFQNFGQTNNLFQQLVVTRNFITNKIRILKNGIITSDITMSNVNAPTATSESVGIGNGNGGSFNGKVSNFNLYNRELSLTEIQQNFNALRSRYGI